MNYSVFISRDLNKDSLFYSLLNTELKIKAYSLLEFKPISFSNIPETDFIFFYSRNAVRFFFSQLGNKKVDSTLCCMGTGTAAILESLGEQTGFVGSGSIDEIAASFLELCINKKILFPRAKHSKKSIQQLIQNQAEVIDLVVYDNGKKISFPNPEADILVFTSPMNVEAYFEKYHYKEERLIAIGETTKQKMESLGLNNILKAKESSEEALGLAVREVLFDLRNKEF